jgi:hypothetical protein
MFKRKFHILQFWVRKIFNYYSNLNKKLVYDKFSQTKNVKAVFTFKPGVRWTSLLSANGLARGREETDQEISPITTQEVTAGGGPQGILACIVEVDHCQK